MFADDAKTKGLSQAITLMADTQIRYLYGDAASADAEAAARPVQLDYYARDMLDWHLAKSGDGTPVVHLGDAVDLSCSQELATFAGVMKAVNRGGAPWFLAPGSHDGYLHGVRHADRDRWNAACGSSRSRGNGAMDKADFVKAYLEALTKEEDKNGCVFPEMAALRAAFDGEGLRDLTCEPLSPKAPGSAQIAGAAETGREPRSLPDARRPVIPRDGDVPLEGCFVAAPSRTRVLRAIAWRIDREAPYRSFVVQSLRLSLPGNPRETTAILLDTAAYPERPTGRTALSLRADRTGDLAADELSIVHRWALEAAASPRGVVLLFGHHPIESLSPDARRSVEEIVDNYHVPLYVSAHTHEGFWKTHDSEGSAWMELNVGSTTDFPPEQRSLQLFTTNERLMVRSRLARVNEVARNDRESGFFRCEGAWQAAPGDAEYDDYYLDGDLARSMSAEERQSRLWDALLRSHRRLFRTIRTKTEANEEPYPDGCSTDDDVGEKILAALRGPASPDDKARLLADLERFDRRRKVVDADCSQRFRLCQALWAGEHQALRGRKLEPHDDTVVLPFR